MIRKIAERVRGVLDPLFLRFPHEQCRHSFSQEGEDMILRYLFRDRRNGYFVDVGAFDPLQFSNTYYFYTRGWRGINVDASAASIARFEQARPKDVNVHSAVTREPGTVTYHELNQSAMSTLLPSLAAERENLPGVETVRKVTLQSQTLASILEKHLPGGQQIDFMSVDVEGMDIEVLSSNDWARFRPTVLLAEDTASFEWGEASASASKGELGNLIREWGYKPIARTVHTVVFVDERPGSRVRELSI